MGKPINERLIGTFSLSRIPNQDELVELSNEVRKFTRTHNYSDLSDKEQSYLLAIYRNGETKIGRI